MDHSLPMRPAVIGWHVVDPATDLPLCGYDPRPVLNFSGPARYMALEDVRNLPMLCQECMGLAKAQDAGQQQELFA